MATIVAVRGAEGIRYRVQIRLKGAPTQSAYFERRTDAKRWAAETEAAIRQGRFFQSTEARRHTLGDLIDRYIEQVLPHKPRSNKDSERHLLWWKDELGTLALSDITPQRLAEYRDRLRSERTTRGELRTAATTNRYLGSLSPAFTVAVREWGWLEHNPCQKVRRMKEPKGRVRFLSKQEREDLLSACQKSSSRFLYPLVLLGLTTGARQGELLELEWKAIDFERRTIRLEQTKNDDRRSLPLTLPCLDELQKLFAARDLGTDLVFPSRDGSKPISIRTSWDSAIEAAGIQDFRFHDLRHTTASYLAMSGATTAEIAEVLGHRTLAMVKRYAHLSSDHVAGVVARMSERFLS